MKVLAALLVALATASSVVSEEEFPFAVKFTLQTPFGEHFCGGSIISDNWVVTAAGCTISAFSGTLYAGINGTYSVPLIAPIFISNPTYDASLFYVGSRFASLNINYPSFYTNSTENSQMGTVVSVFPGYMETTNVTIMGNAYCSSWFPGYTNSMFCTDKCIKNPGASVQVQGQIIGMSSWNPGPYSPAYEGPCAYFRYSAYSPWIRTETGIYD